MRNDEFSRDADGEPVIELRAVSSTDDHVLTFLETWPSRRDRRVAAIRGSGGERPSESS